MENLFLTGPFFHGDTQDFWNDFRGFIDNDPITDANILFRNEIFIMKRGTADGAPRKLYGIKDSRRCKDARPAHLDNNIPQRRFRLFGREFIGHGPAGILSRGPEDVLLPYGVDLDDDTVRVIAKALAALTVTSNECVSLFNGRNLGPSFCRCKPIGLEAIHGIIMRIKAPVPMP